MHRFGVHMNLFKYVLLRTQQVEYHKVSKTTQNNPISLQPLSSAIKAEDWDSYCQSLEEAARKKEQMIQNELTAAKEKEIEMARRELAEKHTAVLKSRLGKPLRMQIHLCSGSRKRNAITYSTISSSSSTTSDNG